MSVKDGRHVLFPSLKSLNGVLHQLVLFKITSQDDFGRPRTLEMCPDDELIDVSLPENRHFMTAYVPRAMATAAKRGEA